MSDLLPGCLENSDLENSDLRPQTSKTQTSKTQTSKTQTSKTQTSKTQTSKTQTSKTQYTFDDNSRSTVLIFPTVFDYWRADFTFFCRFMFIYIYCWTGNKNRQQSNCRSRIYDCVMECLRPVSNGYYHYGFPLGNVIRLHHGPETPFPYFILVSNISPSKIRDIVKVTFCQRVRVEKRYLESNVRFQNKNTALKNSHNQGSNLTLTDHGTRRRYHVTQKAREN